MKKTILFLLPMLLLGQLSRADVVTESEARKKAAEFFNSMEAATKSSSVSEKDFTLVYTLKGTDTKSSSSSPSLYVFDRTGGGYAVVSGDDVAVPVLGWSTGGSFPKEDMPQNMKAMLQWYCEIISNASARGWKTASSSLPNSTGEKVLLSTAQWDQWSPFNDLAPSINGKKPPIGCVATAISIIMRYHRWPEKGTGTLPAYDSKNGGAVTHIDAVELGHTYDWNQMPDAARLNRTATAEQKAQIARLLYDVAVMCEMNFAPSGSGSYIAKATQLVNYFGYDKNMKRLSRSTYPANNLEWEQIIKDQIDAGRPVLYSGSDELGGHAYVIDGYYDRYFSINWGWGGYTNEALPGYDVPIDEREGTGGNRYYYNLSPVEGHDSDLNPFYKYQVMMTDIMPDRGGVENPAYYQPMDYLTFLNKDIVEGKPSRIMTSLYKTSSTQTNVQIRYDLVDRNGVFKETISPVLEKGIRDGATFQLSDCALSSKPEDGDKVCLMLLNPSSGQWEEVKGPRRSKIIFTSRPLSELVEVGYEETSSSSSSYSNPKDFYLKFYKDIFLTVVDNSTGTLLYDPYRGIYYVDGENDVSLIGLTDNEDSDCDTVLVRLAIPSGSYTVTFTNPVTDEEMKISLEF
jgi:hypothetical protein